MQLNKAFELGERLIVKGVPCTVHQFTKNERGEDCMTLSSCYMGLEEIAALSCNKETVKATEEGA